MIIKILAKASELNGDTDNAILWFLDHRIPGFNCKTPKELAESGNADAVLGHLDDLTDGLPA